MKGKITVTNPYNDAYNKKLAFKNNTLSVSCILKIDNTLIDNAEDLDNVMPNYRKLERNNTKKEIEIVLPLKHLSNLCRTLDMPFINC